MPGNLFQIFQTQNGALSHKWRHYFDVYERYFSAFIGKQITILEIGVQGGGSLHMWRKYFGDQATIIGVDISPDCKALEKDGFQIEIGDMGSVEFLEYLKAKLGKVDLIVDDGSHVPTHQILALNALFPILKNGGFYLCEDVYGNYKYTTGTFVDYAKGLVDELHGWWDAELAGEGLFPTQLTATCGGIYFHDGIIVLEKSLQEERFDLIAGDFSLAPAQGKPYPEGPYVTRELLESLPTNADGSKSFHRAPRKESERASFEAYPRIGALVKHRTPDTIVIPTRDPAAWALCWGENFKVSDEGLQVDGAIRSNQFFPAEPGARYKCEFFVRAGSEPDNGVPMVFFAGPIGIDQNGAIIQSAASQPELTQSEGLRRGEVIITADPAAVGIYVGLQGPVGDPRANTLPWFDHISLTQMTD